MAINPVEVVSLLEKINLATINNPKVLQNAAKAIELISNSSNPSIRQKALIFQEKLKENPTFIELNKKEETKQAEIQQKERSEKLQEQLLQARRAASAGDKIEKEKKEERQEKIKEREFKTLLSSGGFSNLPLWQQLDVLDYAFTNYDRLSNEEKTKICENIAESYPDDGRGVSPEQQKANEKVISRVVAEADKIVNSSDPTNNTISLNDAEAMKDATMNVKAHKPSPNEEDLKDIRTAQLLVSNERVALEIGGKVFFRPDANGKLKLFQLVDGVEIDISSKHPEIVAREQNNYDHPIYKNGEKYKEGEQLRNIRKEQLRRADFESSNDIFSTLNQSYEQSNKDAQTLKENGAFSENIDKQAIELYSKSLLFSDVIKSNQDTTMGFHIMMKDFIKGVHCDSNERDLSAYAMFAKCPFITELLNKGQEGEAILKNVMENQWWWGKHCDLLIADMKRIMQEPDFAEKVELAKQDNTDIEVFRARYAQEKLQDSLVEYFRTQHSASYKQLAEKYPEFKDERFYDHLITRDVKELIAFIEKESGVKIEREKLVEFLKARGLTDTDEIKKVLSNNGLGEEAKQENVTLTSESKKNEKAGFLTGFETKEQIEQTISDNSKRLGYETANPSKPENQEQNNNSMQYNQSTSITSNT